MITKQIDTESSNVMGVHTSDVEKLALIARISNLRVAQAFFEMEDGMPKLKHFTLIDLECSKFTCPLNSTNDS